MLARGRGAIINISSTSGLQPLPGNGTYAASKAFVLFHSEALHEEVKTRGVTVTAVCPGPVKTEFQETSDPLFADKMPRFTWRKAERVARDSIRAAERGKRTVIPGGFGMRAMFGPNRMAPTGISLKVARRLMSKELSRPRSPG
jgi:short-subunit dehydrogenase